MLQGSWRSACRRRSEPETAGAMRGDSAAAADRTKRWSGTAIYGRLVAMRRGDRQRGRWPRRSAMATLIVGAPWWLALGGCIDEGSGAPSAETVVEGLNNPTGLGILSDGTLLVVESAAGRIVAVDAEGQVSTRVSGFSLGTFFPYEIGPLSLLVSSDGTLIVGEGGSRTGRERISFYDSRGTELPGGALVPISGSNINSLAIHPLTGDLYAASAGSDRIFRAAAIEGGGFAEPEEFVSDTTAAPIGYEAPSALAFDLEGTLLVGFADFDGSGIVQLSTETGSAGDADAGGADGEQEAPDGDGAEGAEGDGPGDSGEGGVENQEEQARVAGPVAEFSLIREVLTTSRIITAIALRPSDGAVFFAEAELVSNQLGMGRVARIVGLGGGEVSVETYIDALTAPSALAFGADDTMYIATLGTPPNSSTGVVLRIAGEGPSAPAGLSEGPDVAGGSGLGEKQAPPHPVVDGVKQIQGHNPARTPGVEGGSSVRSPGG